MLTALSQGSGIAGRPWLRSEVWVPGAARQRAAGQFWGAGAGLSRRCPARGLVGLSCTVRSLVPLAPSLLCHGDTELQG